MRYFTKEWYLKCQTAPQMKELRDVVEIFQKESAKEDLPQHLREDFMFHDGEILKFETGTDCVIEIESPFSQYHKIRFCNAVMKQELPSIGAIWLYEELYKNKSGIGYEAHILFLKMIKPNHKIILSSDLFETKIICSDILVE